MKIYLVNGTKVMSEEQIGEVQNSLCPELQYDSIIEVTEENAAKLFEAVVE